MIVLNEERGRGRGADAPRERFSNIMPPGARGGAKGGKQGGGGSKEDSGLYCDHLDADGLPPIGLVSGRCHCRGTSF